jgi:cation diffusion facilitator CzcD-associated flavoprotein CzcO
MLREQRCATMADLKVLIIGGGLGGLACAQGLRKHGIPYEIFERDESPNARTQGWALSLHWYFSPTSAPAHAFKRPPIALEYD